MTSKINDIDTIEASGKTLITIPLEVILCAVQISSFAASGAVVMVVHAVFKVHHLGPRVGQLIYPIVLEIRLPVGPKVVGMSDLGRAYSS